MQKDVIYIDTEDDITAVIGKIKDSPQKIIALVPPSRLGALQSAVNLKLAQRAAEQEGKRIVIITGNQALATLAASAHIPTARTLQSRPEMAEVPALEVDDEDIIDGSQVEAEPATTPDGATPSDMSQSPDSTRQTPEKEPDSAASDLKKKVKVPDFNKMRKKLLIGGGVAVILILFLVWAIFFAPSATIKIVARASDAALSTQVTLSNSLQTSLRDGTIKTTAKTTTKNIAIDFTATGKKDVGEKATGVVRFTPSTFAVIRDGATIPSGTMISTSGGLQFTTNESVSFSKDSPGSELMRGKTVKVTAAASGQKYNGVSGSGHGPSDFSVMFTESTSGGTDKTITVVQKSDVEQAQNKMSSSLDADSVKKELSSQFGGDDVVLQDAFQEDKSGVKPTIAIGEEASEGKVQLAGSVKYSLFGIEKNEANTFLDDYFKQQIDGKANQQVYSNGLNKLSITNVSARNDGYTANMTTNGKIGPKINSDELKNFAKGKRYSEIRSHVEEVEGVESADVSFSPFWVQAAPNNTDKITVKFDVNE